MPTSGSNDFNLNAADVVRFAFSKLVPDADDSVSAADMASGIRNLNLMLKSWQLTGPNLWRQSWATQTLTANNGTYTLSTTKPHRIISARYRDASGRDTPMHLLTREEYEELPLKTSTGTPTSYYFDPQVANGVLYVWPVLAAVTTQALHYTYQRRHEDIDAQSNDIDIPQEYLETVGYNLAKRMIPDYPSDNRIRIDSIREMAGDLMAQARASDREPEYRFMPGRY